MALGDGARLGGERENPFKDLPMSCCRYRGTPADRVTICRCCRLTDFLIRFLTGIMSVVCRLIFSSSFVSSGFPRLLLFCTTFWVSLDGGLCQGTEADAKGPLSSLTIIIEDGDGARQLRICSPSENFTLCLTFSMHKEVRTNLPWEIHMSAHKGPHACTLNFFGS